MAAPDQLQKLARLYHLQATYVDGLGQWRQAPPEAILSVLKSLGAAVNSLQDVSGALRERQLRELVRSQIGLMVNDVLENTRANLAGIGSAEDVRGAGRGLAGFSPEFGEKERALKRFMYERLYLHPEQVETAERARDVVAKLFAAYSQDPTLMNDGWIKGLPEQEPDRSRHIADFIAGMTDPYALEQHSRLFDGAGGLG